MSEDCYEMDACPHKKRAESAEAEVTKWKELSFKHKSIAEKQFVMTSDAEAEVKRLKGRLEDIEMADLERGE